LVSPLAIETYPERDVVSLPCCFRVNSEQSLGLRERRRPEAHVLRQSCHERPSDQIPKAEEASVSPLHHLEEAQALLLKLHDHSPH